MNGSIYSDGSYLKSNPGWHVEDSPWKAQQVLRMLKHHHICPHTVAEIGCGAGEILRQLSLNLPETTFSGFDISADAIALARTRESARVQFFNSDFRTTPDHFDVLLVMDVVEHVEDCFGFLRSIREKAEYKIIHIPLDMSVSLLVRNRLMDVRRSVGHIHYFSKHTALALLEDTGYQVLDCFYTPAYQISPKDPVHRVMAAVRSISMKAASDLTSMLFGGCPLLVLAK
jgi:predicted TPR repeat methyltransferase